MRIAAVTVDMLQVPLDPPYSAAGKKVSDYWHVLARITTSDGIEGFGYVVMLDARLVRPLADVTRELGQLLTGMPVMQPEAAWAKISHHIRYGRRPGYRGVTGKTGADRSVDFGSSQAGHAA